MPYRRRRPRTADLHREILVGCLCDALGERFARTWEYDGPLVQRIAEAFVVEHAAEVDAAVDGLVAGTVGYEDAVNEMVPGLVDFARASRPDIEWRDHARSLFTRR